MGPVNLRPPTTVILQATSDNKRKVNQRAIAGALAGARALAGACACAQRVLCSALALALALALRLILQLPFYVHSVLTRLI